MKHYLGTWQHDFPDEPDWMAYEVDDDLSVVRMAEHFPDGRADFRSREAGDVLVDQPFDPLAFAPLDSTMTLNEIAASRFESIWATRRSPETEPHR